VESFKEPFIKAEKRCSTLRNGSAFPSEPSLRDFNGKTMMVMKVTSMFRMMTKMT
jgi:hypothetical protein